jgi:hypothetical protein
MRVCPGLRVVLGVLAAMAMTAGRVAAQVPQTQIVDDSKAMVPPEEFAVFPWDYLPATKEAYEEARECGMNLAGFVLPEDLDKVQAAGIKCWVADPEIKIRGAEKATDAEIEAKVKEIVARSAGHPANYGYHVIDEPSAALVPLVARWAKAIEAAAPGTVVYTNFLPIPGGKAADTSGPYERYLTGYLEAVRPKAFSFDHYALLDDGTVRPNYFAGLEVVRRASLKTGVPFYQVCLANSHFHYVEPSPASLRFQVFVSLAYGAKGVGWFTYTGRDRGNYRSAAIDLAGRRTPTWDMLRDANMMAHRLAPVYTKWKSVGVFHYPAVPDGCVGIDQSRYFNKLTGQGPFLVGEFEGADGKAGVIIVNRDLNRSTQVGWKLKKDAKVLRVSTLTGKVRPWGAEDNWIAPGGAVVLILEPTGQ